MLEESQPPMDGSPEEEVEQVEQVSASEEIPETEIDDKSLQTITVQNLRHPGGWLTNRQFQSVLNKSVDFNAEFSRPAFSDEKQVKTGSITLVFSSHSIARDAYTSLQKMIIDGFRPEALVDPRFFSIETSSPNRQFFENANDSRIVFLLDAPKSIDENMIEYFFGGEKPIHFQTLPMPSENGLFQVEVLLSNGEAAKTVLAGESKFSISDEDVECEVKLLSPREYALYSKMDDVRPSKAPTKAARPATEPQGQLAPEIDEDVVTNRILQIIEERNLNLAEINDKDEIYELCDEVSSEFNGIPDSILKPAMGTVLQRHLNRTEMHWMREHIEGLLRVWKAEIMNEHIYERPSFVPMETNNYVPVMGEEEVKGTSKTAAKRQKAARAQMGVGAFLTANRDRLIVETGDVEMESDDDGNVMIGGEALSFDSWAKITKTKASGVVRANDDGTKKIGNGGLTKKQMRQARIVEGMSQEEWKNWKKEKDSTRKQDIKERIMARGGVIEGEEAGERKEGGEEATSSEVPVPPPVPPPKKDLDEGEIDSEEERKEAANKNKKRKVSSDSSDSSSSSSSEEDEDGPVDARKRRKMRRKKDRKLPRGNQSSAPQLDPNFRQMFENRKAIIAQMTPQHKAAFASALNQIIQNNSSVSTAKASQAISSMMSGFR